jgi:hypothetical protein
MLFDYGWNYLRMAIKDARMQQKNRNILLLRFFLH